MAKQCIWKQVLKEMHKIQIQFMEVVLLDRVDFSLVNFYMKYNRFPYIDKVEKNDLEGVVFFLDIVIHLYR